jgi:hypothetical protein
LKNLARKKPMNLREIRDRLRTVEDRVGPDHELSALIDDLQLYLNNGEKITNIHEGQKPIILVDFDGVIHSYKSGWKGVDVIPDEPVDMVLPWLMELTEQFDVRIFSARCNDAAGITAMIRWFRHWGLSYEEVKRLTFEPGKPSAFLIIDDRAMCFNGKKLPFPEKLRAFKPWYYGEPAWGR